MSLKYNPYELQTWQCKHSHEFSSKYSTIKSQKVWCPYCSSGVGERVCRIVFESLFGVPFTKVRPDWLLNREGNRLELDGFSDHVKIAFEHNGKQHYSEKYHRGTEKLIRDDTIKKEHCKQNGHLQQHRYATTHGRNPRFAVKCHIFLLHFLHVVSVFFFDYIQLGFEDTHFCRTDV